MKSDKFCPICWRNNLKWAQGKWACTFCNTTHYDEALVTQEDIYDELELDEVLGE